MNKEHFFDIIKKYFSEEYIDSVMSWIYLEEGDEITEKNAEAFLFQLPGVKVTRGEYTYADMLDYIGVTAKDGRKGKIECEWSSFKKFFSILEGTDPVQAGWEIEWE